LSYLQFRIEAIVVQHHTDNVVIGNTLNVPEALVVRMRKHVNLLDLDDGLNLVATFSSGTQLGQASLSFRGPQHRQRALFKQVLDHWQSSLEHMHQRLVDSVVHSLVDMLDV
jgi:hypothetical protein